MGTFTAKRDMGKCSRCLFQIMEGDGIEGDGGEGYQHERCAEDTERQHVVEWKYAVSDERQTWDETELRRVAPVGKQGKCSICFIELPLTGICDEHGRSR